MLVQIRELVKDPEGGYIWVNFEEPREVATSQEALQIVYSLEDQYMRQGRSFNFNIVEREIEEAIFEDIPEGYEESCLEGVMESEWEDSKYAPMPEYDPKNDVF